MLESRNIYLTSDVKEDSKKQFYAHQKNLINKLQELTLNRYGADDVVFISDDLSGVPGLRTVIARKTLSCELISSLNTFLKESSPNYIIAITLFEDIYKGKTY